MIEKLTRFYTDVKKSVVLTVSLCTFSMVLQAMLCMVTPSHTYAAVTNIPAQLNGDSLVLAPYLEAFVDTTGKLTIEDVQSMDIQRKFAPFHLGESQSETGALWLRFTLSARSDDTESEALLLDMGASMAQKPRLYVPFVNPLKKQKEWQQISPSKRAIFLMPEAEKTAITAYVRLEAVPSIWFAPFIRTPHNAATSLELLAYPAASVALGMVVLLCLMRGLTERGQWRFWVGLYTAVALFYTLNGLPMTSMSYVPMENLLAVLAPGVALILLPHVGRHIMSTPVNSRAIDLQYVGLTLVGAVAALLPLVPGFVWSIRYLELWPVLTLLFVPTTIAAWMSGLVGARRFLIACLLPPLGVGIALVGLDPLGLSFFPVAALPAFPLWGIALGAFILAGTTNPRLYIQGEGSVTTVMPSVESVIQNDPNLRLVPVDEAQSIDPVNAEDTNGAPKKAISDLEERLRWPVEQLNREVAALEGCSLPIGARDTINALSNTARDIANILQAPAHQRMAAPTMGGIEEYVFDLQSLLRQAHDSVSPVADKKNIALSWFMPPHLSRCYKGDALQLLFVLRLLLESSVRSTHRGAVQLAVRRVPESVNPGHLLFTVSDTGTGKPPQERSVTALARAWELSASYHGFLGVESNAHGASISFTVNCEVCTSVDRETSAQAQEKNTRKPIFIISDNAEDRHRWGFFLEQVDNPVREVRNCDEAVSLFKEQPAALMIFDARMPTPYVEKAMQSLQHICQEREESFPQCLAIYMEDAPENLDESGVELQEIVLRDMGFAHMLALPVTRQNLREQVDSILFEQHVDQLDAQIPREHQETQDEVFTVYEKESTFADPQEENSDLEDEIIDTGMPVLDMHAPASPTVSAHTEEHDNRLQSLDFDFGDTLVQAQEETQSSQHTPLSDAMFFPATEEEPSTAQDTPDEYVYDPQPVPSTQEDAPYEEANSQMQSAIETAMQNAMAAAAPSFVAPVTEEDQFEHEVQTLAEASSEVQQLIENTSEFVRPAPSEDKSNAVYLSSLLDMDTPEPEAAPVVKQPKKTPPSVKTKSISTKSSTKIVPQAQVPQAQVPQAQAPQAQVPQAQPIVSTQPSTRPAVKVVKKATEKPRGSVPFEPSTTDSIGGGDGWVGEPTPMSASATKAPTAPTRRVVERETPIRVPVDQARTQQGNVSAPMAQAPQAQAPQAPIAAAKPKAKPVPSKAFIPDRAQAPSMPQTSQPPLSMSQAVEKEDKAAQIAALLGTPPPKPPVRKPAPPTSSLLDDAPLSFEPQRTPLGDAPEDILDSLDGKDALETLKGLAEPLELHDADAEQRGREEIRQLRNYLNKIEEIESVKKTLGFSKETPQAPQTPVKKPKIEPLEMPKPVVKQPVQQPAQQPKPVKNASPFDWLQDAKSAPVDPDPIQQEGIQPAMLTGMGNIAKVEFTQEKKSTSYADHVRDVLEGKDSAPKEKKPLTPIESLLKDIDTSLEEAKGYLATGNLEEVERTASSMAHSAEAFGLRTLARLARTVESAARAQDMSALRDLVPELEMSVHRNRVAFQGK